MSRVSAAEFCGTRILEQLLEESFDDVEGLAIGTELLNGQFLIQARLQSGGFGIAYVARDSLARQVVVKECFPGEVCKRTGITVKPATTDLKPQFEAIKGQFVREARQLAKLVHPNIVAVHQVFEENNTAYMALDQVQGEDFVTIAEDTPARITNEFLSSALRQCLDAVGFIHQNRVLHRDISPDNIMINDDDEVTMIDFGASKEHSEHAVTAIFSVKDGFSPYEFYTPKGKHDFSSDIYALGATFYYLITGDPPPDSVARLKALIAGQKDPYDRLVEGDWPFDYNILVTIDRALKMRQKNRYQTAAQWLEDLENQPKKHPLPPAMIRFDPNLENDIARIVEITNTQMTKVNGGANDPDTTDHMQTVDMQDEQIDEQTLFDIYGNPIDDFESWQQEQELEIETRQRQLTLQKERGASAAEPSASRRAGFLSRLFTRCFARNRSGEAARENP